MSVFDLQEADCYPSPHWNNPPRKPRLLDLFCGAGGAAKGYQRAGFYVVGVDIEPQPNYCGDEFAQMDALEVLARVVRRGEFKPAVPVSKVFGGFDAIHASPPCQHYAAATAWRGSRDSHPDLIGPTRELLEATGLPFIIENVPDARHELRQPVTVCGEWFGLRVRRHRLFESGGGFRLRPMVKRCRHIGLLPFEHKQERAYADAMGCDWMSSVEAREAIPPAYTEWIGAQLMNHVAPDCVSSGAPKPGSESAGSGVGSDGGQ